MKCSVALLMLALLVLVTVTTAQAEVTIRSPGSPPSKVAKDGALVEPWGAVRLQIVDPAEAQVSEQVAEEAPMPVTVTTVNAGAVTLTQSAYRAPIWPSGVDVLEATASNDGDSPTTVQLELVVPEAMQVGETVGSIEGTPSVVLPDGLQAVREEREWGCTGGLSALPGWARPERPCDPSFRNIAAGMGGVPIKYRFAVKSGTMCSVVLGFCESHHPGPGVRPVIASVEGAEERSIDPNTSWGRHVPGVARFDAADADGNGRLEVTVAPHPHAGDRNPILNVLWIFDRSTNIDEEKLIAGELNDRARYFVDVGGENDQLLYKPGNVRFVLELQPKEQRDFLFLVRSPGCRYLPDMSLGLWNQKTLRKAAADVWKDRWEEPVETPEK